jgi:hypothetical protein
MIPTVLRSALRSVEMPVREYLGALWPAALATGGVVAVVLLARTLLPTSWSLPYRFAFEVLLGVAVYAIGVYPAYKTRFRTLVSLFRSRKNPTPSPV